MPKDWQGHPTSKIFFESRKSTKKVTLKKPSDKDVVPTYPRIQGLLHC